MTPSPDRPRLTETGAVVGTPGYVSPEQLEGSTGDSRSDIFSFGTVLYELLTGKNPFQGLTASSTAARILTLDPPALSSVNPLSPPALDAIVRRCLEKVPDARYAFAGDLLTDLEALDVALASGVATPIPMAPPPTRAATVPPGRSWWRIHQRIVMVVVALLAIGCWWLAAWAGGSLRYLLFAAVLGLAVADGTMRVNLLFVEQQGLTAIVDQLARTRPWLLGIELALGFLVAGSAARVLADHQAVGITMLAVTAALVVTVWAIEPVTTDAAFRRNRNQPHAAG